MFIKKSAYEAVVTKLENERQSVEWKIRHNKDEFKKLAREQSTLKRERGIITELIRDVKGKAEREEKAKC